MDMSFLKKLPPAASEPLAFLGGLVVMAAAVLLTVSTMNGLTMAFGDEGAHTAIALMTILMVTGLTLGSLRTMLKFKPGWFGDVIRLLALNAFVWSYAYPHLIQPYILPIFR
jgi:hypothetical protein